MYYVLRRNCHNKAAKAKAKAAKSSMNCGQRGEWGTECGLVQKKSEPHKGAQVRSRTKINILYKL